MGRTHSHLVINDNQLISSVDRPHNFDAGVFVNCPFDEDYLELLRPLLFAIVYLGFEPRISSERSDSGESRIEKICQLILSSRLSIHDLSRLQASEEGEYYRLNMPFELGIDYGIRLYGPCYTKDKIFLILESEDHEYKKALSDLYNLFALKSGWRFRSTGMQYGSPEKPVAQSRSADIGIVVLREYLTMSEK